MWNYIIAIVIVLIITIPMIFFYGADRETKTYNVENFRTSVNVNGRSVEVNETFDDDTIEDIKTIFRNLSMNKDQINISGDYKTFEYIPGTIDQYLMGNLRKITERTLGRYCKRLKPSDVDRVRLKVSSDERVKEYDYEVFVYDVVGSVLVKARVNAYVVVEPGLRQYTETCTSVTNYPFTNYEIGIPCKDQLVPLPTQVIPSANLVISEKGKTKQFLDKILRFHLNGIRIENSTQIPNPGDDWSDNLPLTDLFSRAIKTPVEKANVYNKWPDVKDLTGKPPIFNIPNPFVWNSLGVPNEMPKIKEGENYTYALTPTERDPKYWPFNVRGPKFGGAYCWLFDLGRDITQFPHGRATSG